MNARERRIGIVLAGCVALLLAVCSFGAIANPARAALTPEWTAAPDMGATRAQAVVVGDGGDLVYVFGGVAAIAGASYGPTEDNSYSYNVATGEWIELARMPVGVRGAAGALGSDGRIYVIAGYNSTAGQVNLNQIYDPETNLWSSGLALPEICWEAKACGDAYGRIYLFGGEVANGRTYVYDIEADSWAAGPAMPVALLGGVAISDGYYSYYIGGATSGYSATTYVYIYYPWGSWWEIASLPVATSAHAGVMATDGMIYIFGGADDAYNVGDGYTQGFCFNRWTNEFSPLPDMAIGARYLGAAAGSDGRIFALGGNNDTTVMSKVEVIDILDVTFTISSTAVGPGEEILVTVDADFAYAVPTQYYGTAYLLYDLTTVYSSIEFFSVEGGPFGFVLDVPEAALPGAYEAIVVYLWTDYEEGGGTSLGDARMPFTVLDTYTLEEQLAMLEANMSELEESLAAQIALLEAALANQDANISALQADLNTLQAALNALQNLVNELMDEQEFQAEDLEDLNASVADLQAQLDGLQTELDALQEQLDDVETTSSSGSTWGMVNLVLLIIVIVLLVMMFLMSRKGKAPPPPGE